MVFSLGLTGSIGMGKSTTAALFKEAGCAVWDADAAVHALYAKGGAAVAPIGDAFPEVTAAGFVDRDILKELISLNKSVLKVLEDIVHPLVQADRQRFRIAAEADILVFDIPLLFETGSQAEMDAVACVFVSPEMQRQRVLARGTMTEPQFEQILAKQMPIEEKLARSDFRIETDTMEHARAQVTAVVEDIKRRMAHA
ncbi:MAG: dephospho-CoA kinase [Epibacterium sp.]